MSKIAGINLNTNPAIPVMPDVFCLFPAPTPSRFAIPVPRKKVDKKGASQRSKPVSIIVDTGAPNPPQNLSAGSAAGGAVSLLWSLPAGEAPASYNIYRSTNETVFSVGIDSATLKAASGIAALEYNDYPPLDGIYYYGAASVDAAGNESGLSNISAAVSDRLVPSASIAVSSVPPLGAGSYEVTMYPKAEMTQLGKAEKHDKT